MRNLSKINDLYNVKDTIILCENMESRAALIHEKYEFNPTKWNSVSTISGCIQRNQSKVINALPTDRASVELFEKISYRRF